MLSNEKSEIEKKLIKQMKLLANTSLDSYEDFFNKSKELTHQMIEWNHIMEKVNSAIENLNEDLTFFNTTFYLAIFEINYVSLIDCICFLYIKNGLILKNNSINNFDSIGRVNTSIKHDFLEKQGLDTLVRKEDNQLRNKIAHYDFTIISKGKLSVQEKEIDIIRRAIELNSFVKEIVEMLNRTTEIVKANLDSKANEIRQLMDELQKRKIK